MNYSIDSRYYTDPEIYRQERRQIFASHWWLLGPASSCCEIDNYLCDTVCGWPVFVVRDKAGQLRGFHNVCRHRGSILLDDGQGSCAAIRCPYHGWLYGTDGQLRKTAGFGADLDQDKLGLFPLQVQVWRGMIFIKPSAGEPAEREVTDSEAGDDFNAWLGELPVLYQGFPDIEQMQFHGRFEVPGAANWKTYCDNTVEGYHLNSVHPRLAAAVASGTVDIVSYDSGSLVAFHVGYGGAAGGAELRGNAGLWTYKFPGFQIAASENAFKIERVEPNGVDRLRSINWAWYRNLDYRQRIDSFDWSRRVVAEDISICEKVQRNLDTGVYRNGPLSPRKEIHVAGLQQHYLQQLEVTDN